jgi:sorbitol-specific phosphotransferase system component IIC
VLGGWAWLTTPGATIVPSVVVLTLLLWKRRHRDELGRVSRQKLASSVVLPATLYVLVICIVGHFFFSTPVSMTVTKFGDERTAWLMTALCGDVLYRLWVLFDGRID